MFCLFIYFIFPFYEKKKIGKLLIRLKFFCAQLLNKLRNPKRPLIYPKNQKKKSDFPGPDIPSLPDGFTHLFTHPLRYLIFFFFFFTPVWFQFITMF